MAEDIGFYNAMQAELVRPPAILSGEIKIRKHLPNGVLVIARRAKEGGGPQWLYSDYLLIFQRRSHSEKGTW